MMALFALYHFQFPKWLASVITFQIYPTEIETCEQWFPLVLLFSRNMTKNESLDISPAFSLLLELLILRSYVFPPSPYSRKKNWRKKEAADISTYLSFLLFIFSNFLRNVQKIHQDLTQVISFVLELFN